MDFLHDRVEHDFNYHTPSSDGILSMQILRKLERELAHKLVDFVPTGRELSIALTKLEEVMMWANAGVARGNE